MAFELTKTTPFPTNTFDILDTDLEGLQLNPNFRTNSLADLDSTLSDLRDINVPFNLNRVDSSYYTATNGVTSVSDEPLMTKTHSLSTIANSTKDLVVRAKNQQAGGAVLKMAASAGRLFTDLLAAGGIWENIHAQEYNTKLSADVQMAALDNQILYFKNQIADRFNKTMARNAVTMAAKNLRVTAGNLLEQTKEEAYDATQDIATYTSNAELQKILLRSQQQQADVAAKLMKSNVVTDMISDLADLGLMVGTKGGTFAKDWGTLFSGTQFDDTYKSVYKTANEAYDWTAGQLTSAKNWFKDTFKIKGIQND